MREMGKRAMKTVGDVLKQKGSDVSFVEPETTVFETLQLMAQKDIGAVLVLQSGEVVGIFSERDYAREVILEGLSSKDTPVKDVMTRKVAIVQPGQTLGECMALMTDKRIRHLPVFDDGSLIGIVSIGDLVGAAISEKKFRIAELENYIKTPGAK